MLESFVKNFKELTDYAANKKILAAVSGGIDSMVMLDLFIKADINVSIAHCNFNLRGKESDDDELFIRKTAHKKNIPLHVNTFNTAEFASQNSISIQMAARELRFNWFYQLMREHNYNYIALAHNLNDKVETFFLNIIRGTGLKGIKGMQPLKNDIIRPVLQFSRKEIKEYANEYNIKFREDSSNSSLKYLRNKIRHEIIPDFETCEPSFLRIMNENISRFNEAWRIYKEYINNISDKILLKEGKTTKINIAALKDQKNKESIAYELLSPFYFTQSVISDIVECLDHQSGKQFYSNTHRCIKDREFLIITKKVLATHNKYYLDEKITEISKPVSLSFEYIAYDENFEINKNKNVAQLDYDLLNFPLILRKWEKGDFFQPLGMNGLKKISDFFSDQKFSLYDKESTWLITSGEKIVWIVGHRIDNRFKISPKTRNILKIIFQ